MNLEVHPLLHLSGHEHSDHFYLYKNITNIWGFSLIPNSIMASDNFPGFRIYYSEIM